ncbi:MAG: zincin-like metallopeptidase domain-containing protein [Bacteroides cellulosilyticus]|nr:zincin-like metallopeptidase domain-containing protein [Bacteroides cellulosilyticus]
MNADLIANIALRFAELMIRKIETLESEWHKPWIADMAHGLPRNLRGTPYRAGNALLLLILSEMEQFKTPIFLTFKQAKEESLNIRKGSSSFPVYFWKMYIRHKETRRKIEQEEYCKLPHEVQKQYDAMPVMRYYPVFNIDQTDMDEKQPECYAQLTAETAPKDHSDGLICDALDSLIERQKWVCPVELEYSDRACFIPSLDKIICPLKTQFPARAEFYGTLLHEMTHSTGVESRLGRKFGTSRGDADYAREELVAEFTAALCGALLGFATTPRNENAAYLKHWLGNLAADPKYLFDILTDVNRAARMITERLETSGHEAEQAA